MLLSGMMRSQAIYGTSDVWGTRLFGRQGGRWARQLVDQAMPTPAKEARLRELTELRERGVVTDAEFHHMRKRLGL
jgi:Short C-terminal domain